ncbi:hypothetical protein MTO96_034950 [Rhipicephalus appendiculatus]
MSLSKCVQPHRGAPSPGVATRISCCTDLQRTLPLRIEQLAKLRPMSSWFFPRLATHQFHPRATPGYATGNTITRRGNTLPHAKSSPCRIDSKLDSE